VASIVLAQLLGAAWALEAPNGKEITPNPKKATDKRNDFNTFKRIWLVSKKFFYLKNYLLINILY